MHSELIQALIHSQPDLCNLQLHTHAQCRIRWYPALCSLEKTSVHLYIVGGNAQTSLSKLKLPAPQRECGSFSISLETESCRGKKKKTLITLPLKIAMDEPPTFSGPAQHQSHSLKVQKDLFKSSELCCSTRCYLLLSALSQWIGLHFGKHISCSYFEHRFPSLVWVFLVSFPCV